MFRPTISLVTLLCCVFAVSAGAKPEVRNGEESIRVVFNKHARSLCTLALDMRLPCEPGIQGDSSNTTPTKCTCNNLYFNLWKACALLEGDRAVLPGYLEWSASCRKVSTVLEDGLNMPTVALIGVQGDNASRSHSVLEGRAENPPGCVPHWSTLQIVAPVISGLTMPILVWAIMMLWGSNSSKKRRWPRNLQHLVMPSIPRVHKVRKADRSDTWSIDQTSQATDEFVVIEEGDADSFRVKSPEPFSRVGKEVSPQKGEWRIPGKALWKKPLQLPSRFPVPWGERAVAVQSVPPTRRFHIDSVDHSTLSGPSIGGSTEGGHGTSPVKNSANGGSRTHETIEEVSDEDEGTSLISPGARSENHVFLISNQDGFTVESSSSSTSHQVIVQPPTATASTHNSALISKSKPIPHIPPPPTKPAPSPPVLSPRVPPQLQYTPPITTTSQLMDAHVPIIPQPSLSTPPRHTPGPLHIDLRRQLSAEEDDPLRRNAQPARRPVGARQSLISPSSRESLRHENAFSNPQYSAQVHQRQLSDSAVGRSLLFYPSGTSPPRVHRQLSIEEELLRPSVHSPGIAGSSSQAPHTSTPIPHHRGHSADDVVPAHHVPHHNHTRTFSSESVAHLRRSDPINLFPGAVRATGYPVLQAATESSNSLYSDGSYPQQPPSVAHPYPHHRL